MCTACRLCLPSACLSPLFVSVYSASKLDAQFAQRPSVPAAKEEPISINISKGCSHSTCLSLFTSAYSFPVNWFLPAITATVCAVFAGKKIVLFNQCAPTLVDTAKSSAINESLIALCFLPPVIACLPNLCRSTPSSSSSSSSSLRLPKAAI